MKQKYTITVSDVEMNVICEESPETVEVRKHGRRAGSGKRRASQRAGGSSQKSVNRLGQRPQIGASHERVGAPCLYCRTTGGNV